MQRRTRLATAALLTVATLGLAGCTSGGGNNNGGDATKAHGPITIWYSNNEQEVSWGKAMVQAWNSAHPKEKIKGQEVPAGKSTEEVIGAAITAGTTPCLVFNNLPAATGQFQKQGGLVDLSNFPGANNYIESRSGKKVADQYKSSDGDFYQMPWKSNPVMIFYNKDIFAKAGLDPDNPKLSTYADFLDTAKQIVSSGAAKYAIYPSPTSEFFQPNFDFLPLYAAESNGTSIIENDKATIDSQAGLDVATFWKSIYSNNLAGKEPVQSDAFASGTSAMAIVGPWAIPVYKKINWGSVPVPTKNGTSADKTYTFPDAKNIGMYTSCKNQGTAWDVLKFATSKAQDGKLLETTGQMPIRTDLPTTFADYFTKNPAYKEFANQSARTVDDPTGPNTIATLQDLRNFYTKSVISGQGNLKSDLAQAAKKMTSEWNRK
ncbi:sugar ABC transporter substrate-binding protein [Microbacterium sp. STN6]|uniref:ABC transporter substrate-binding protein n=1 Tax=Microbacterium sp. STN6 TaxID=2995588 RepID=UPI002260B9A2|nr:sugar ABC transporter substrate-binding protein [Microbacterium sp. STN6]MCX7522576.1 sugar ABC transporter substrate-binding protein [Microbacterium sp. STN6]